MKTQNLSYQSRPLILGELCSASSCGQYPVIIKEGPKNVIHSLPYKNPPQGFCLCCSLQIHWLSKNEVEQEAMHAT